MTKLEMAHDCALAYIKYGDGKTHYKDVVEFAWRYADAMQAEAEKREQEASEKSSKEINNILENHEHVFVNGRICWCGKIKSDLEDEWQPDWGVAPKWANYWMVAPNGGANWLSNHPSSDPLISKALGAPLFNYQGSWENSLRKRP